MKINSIEMLFETKEADVDIVELTLMGIWLIKSLKLDGFRLEELEREDEDENKFYYRAVFTKGE